MDIYKVFVALVIMGFIGWGVLEFAVMYNKVQRMKKNQAAVEKLQEMKFFSRGVK